MTDYLYDYLYMCVQHIIIIITGQNKYSGKWGQGGLDTLSSTGNKENCNNLTTVTTYLQIPLLPLASLYSVDLTCQICKL